MEKNKPVIFAIAVLAIAAVIIAVFLLGQGPDGDGPGTNAVVEEMFSCQTGSDCVFAGQGSGFDEHPGCVNDQWWNENYSNASYAMPAPNECACVNQRCALKSTGSLIMYTDPDKSDYYPSEIVEVTVHNNSAKPAWYKTVDFQGCNLGAIMTKDPLELERYRLYSGLPGGEWAPVPTSSDDDFGMTCGYAMQEMESGEFRTMQHFLGNFYEPEQFGLSEYDQLLTSRYRLAIEYAAVNDLAKVEKAYSDEFTILHETECERIERETPGLLEDVKTCERDSECIAEEVVSTGFAMCHLIRSNQYDSSFELSRVNQNLMDYATECGGSVMVACDSAPEDLACKGNKCVESTPIVYPPNTGSVEDRQEIEDTFQIYLGAMESCDIELAKSLITEKSNEIMRHSCSGMTRERECYAGKDHEIHSKANIAMLYFPPFNHKEGWPLFFARENGKWKFDFHKMAFGITMGGSGCSTGWGWISQETADEFCSYFPEGECPEPYN